MRFVEDDGKVLVGKPFVQNDLLHGVRERLNRNDDDPASLFKLLSEFSALCFAFFLTDSDGYAVFGFEAHHGTTQLIIQNGSVRNNEDRVEERTPVSVAKI